MITPERLVQCLSTTFSGTSSEHIRQAEVELSSQYQYPEFPYLLSRLITSPLSSNQSLCIASILQLRGYFISNPQFIAEKSIELITQISENIPPNVQPILEILSRTIVDFFNQNNHQLLLIQLIQSILVEKSSIFGFILLDSLLNLQKKAQKEFYQAVEPLINFEYHLITKLIHDSSGDQLNGVYLHYFADSYVHQLIENSESPEKEIPFFMLSVQILQSQLLSPIFDIADDFLEIILNCLILYPNSFDISFFMNASISYFQGSPSFAGLTQFYRIMKIILCNEQSFQLVSSNLPQILQMFFLPVFQLTEDDHFSFETDPSQFLENNFPGTEEDETPKSAALNCLLYASQNSPQISSIVFRLAIQNISGSDEWQTFSSILFFSATSRFFAETCNEFQQFLELISKNISSSHPVLVSSSLLFLANFPFAFSALSAQFIGVCLNLLTTNISPLIQYLSSCSVGQILSFEIVDTTTLPSNVVTASIQNLFIVSQQFPTERIATALSAFVQFFSGNFVQFSENCIFTLMQLLVQYMNSDSTEARKSTSLFSSAICQMCTNIKNQNTFDFILNEVGNMIEEQLFVTFCEEILPLIEGCVKNATSVTEQIVSIPNMLITMFAGEGREEVVQMSSIFKAFALRFGNQINFKDVITRPIVSIMQSLIEDMCDDDFEAMTTFCQILFIYFPNDEETNELIEQWAPMLAETYSPFCADALAAMIQRNPAAVVNNVQNAYDNWINNSRPKAFISSAAALLSNISSLLPEIQSQQQTILSSVQQRMKILNSEEYDNDENDEFFNMENITSFFKQH